MVLVARSVKRSLAVVVSLLVMVSLMIPVGVMSSVKAYGQTVLPVPLDSVCSIGDQGYTNLEDALSAAKDGDTIKLLADIDYNKSITVDGMTLTFDTNGHVLNVNDPFDPDAFFSYAMMVKDNGCVNLEDTSVAGNGQLNVTAGEDGYYDGVGGYYYGLAVFGGSATVTNASGTCDGVLINNSDGNPCTVTVLGDVTGYSEGILFEQGSFALVTVTVNGNVTSQHVGIKISGSAIPTDLMNSITIMGSVIASAEGVVFDNIGGTFNFVVVNGTVSHAANCALVKFITGDPSDPETYNVVLMNESDGQRVSDAEPFTRLYQQGTAQLKVKGIIVVHPDLTGIEVSTPPTKTEYNVGDTLDLSGMEITAQYSDGSSQAVTDFTTDPVAGTTLIDAGTQSVQVSYQDMTASFPITVDAVEPVTGAPGSGDLFGTGQVTMDVAMIVAQIVTGGGMELTPAQFAAVDMDGDGILTMNDVMLIMQKAAGL